jgi:hypothetical protein
MAKQVKVDGYLDAEDALFDELPELENTDITIEKRTFHGIPSYGVYDSNGDVIAEVHEDGTVVPIPKRP